ncbi:hypothetical protein D3C85_1863380 [compost metagenome]
MKAVDQANVAGKRHPFQPAHGQQVSDGDDARSCAASIAGGQIAGFDDACAVHGATGSGADQWFD